MKLVLQLAVQRGWDIWIADLLEAFLQGDKYTAGEKPTYITIPPILAGINLDGWQFPNRGYIKLKKPLYGL